VQRVRETGHTTMLLFLEASDGELVRRYRETRRVHPLSPDGSVEQGIERERRLLAEVASLADVQIDTTALNVHQLKQAIVRFVSGEARRTVINVISFGFRYGTPRSVELLFDMRFLPNPYFEPELRWMTGLEAPVASYVLESDRGAAFLSRLRDFIDYVLPMYDAEGKAYVTIGIGCTGGRHRSVVIAEAISSWLRGLDREVFLTHRDVERVE